MARPTAAQRGTSATSRGTRPAKRPGGVQTLAEVTVEGDPRRADPPQEYTTAEQVISVEPTYETKLARAKQYAGKRGYIERGDVEAFGIGFWNALKPWYLPEVPVPPQHAGAEHMGRELALNLVFEAVGGAMTAQAAGKAGQGAVRVAEEAVAASGATSTAQRVIAAAKAAIRARSPSRYFEFLRGKGASLIEELMRVVKEPIHLGPELAAAGAPRGAMRAAEEAAVVSRGTSAAQRGTATARQATGTVKAPLKPKPAAAAIGSKRIPALAGMAPKQAAEVVEQLIKTAKRPIVLRDLTPEIVEAMKAKHGSEKVARMFRRAGGMIAPYDALKAVTLGFEGRIQAHHIVEEQVLKELHQPVDKAVAVVVTVKQHSALSTSLAETIGTTKFEMLNTGSRAAYRRAYEQVYWGMPEWLAEVRRVLR